MVAAGLLALLGVAVAAETGTPKNEAQVRAALDEYVEAVQDENLEQYARVVAHDADMVNFGAFGEPIIGWEALRGVIEGQNAALDSIRIEQSQVKVHVLASGANAWATSLWRLRAKAGENSLDLPIRCTWELEKHGDVWQVVHFHKSIAAR
jgi:ketosteroid isomerase-like protein